MRLVSSSSSSSSFACLYIGVTTSLLEFVRQRKMNDQNDAIVQLRVVVCWLCVNAVCISIAFLYLLACTFIVRSLCYFMIDLID